MKQPDDRLQTETITVLGQPIANLTIRETITHLGAMVVSGRPHHVVTVNPEFLMEARRNPTFRRALNRADLAVADGIGVLLAGILQRRPFKTRVAGVDLVVALAAESAVQGWRPFFLGAAPGVAEQAATRLQARFPGLRPAGCYAGAPTPVETPDLIARVNAANPDLLFVAYGHPTQDIWISEHRMALGVPVMMGVGGAFDFIAGVVPRAPASMRRLGLEWLYRLCRQPWRWRRMLALPHFFLLALLEALTRDRTS